MLKKIFSAVLTFSLILGIAGTFSENRVIAKENISHTKLYEFKGYIEDTPLNTVSKSYGANDKDIWNSFSNDYFYNKMDQNQKIFYDGLKAQVEDFFYNERDAKPFKVAGGETVYGVGGAVSFNGLTAEEASSIYLVFANSNPQFYFLSNTSAYDTKNYYIVCTSEYANAMTRRSYNKLFFDTVNSYISDIKSYSDKKEERQRRIHTLVAEKLTYATSNSLDWGPYQTSASAVFIGKTVCAGYSELYALLCNAVGIPCICITSDTHEWNMVNYGKYWYCVDITYDDTDNGNSPIWKYYNQPKSPYFTDATHDPEPIYKKLLTPDAKYNFGEKPLDTQVGTVYRLFNKALGEHFFTKNAGERATLLKYSIWKDEGVAFVSYPDNTSVPVYRVYHHQSGTHLYTVDTNLVSRLEGEGWRNEGIGFYSDPNKTHPVYALRNPHLGTIGGYHYTKNYDEANTLVNKYKFEYLGIGWYACEED